MCEICFDGDCSNPYNHPQELTYENLTKEGFETMLTTINELQNLLDKKENDD